MRRSLLTCTVSILLVLPIFALAATDPCTQGTTGQGNFVPLACYKGTPLADVYSATGEQNTLALYINRLFAIALSAGAIIAVVRLMFAGFLYMGSDFWDKKNKAKEIIQDVVLGILLLLGTYLILAQINPEILNLNILKSFGGGSGVPSLRSDVSPDT
ncbi:MAG TPA: hypothetical protein VJK53_04355 [Candidatus Paceibacterota bacterium]